MFNWFWNFLYGLVKVPLLCIDVILMIARKLCGIDPIRIETEVGGEVIGKDVDLLSYFMEGKTIINAFGYVCLFGFILLFLFTVFRIIKDQAVFYEKKSPLRICIESARILLYFLLVPSIMILGTTFISIIMNGIYEATANGNSGLSGAMFGIFAEEAYIGPEIDKRAVLEAFRTCSLEEYVSGANQFSYYNTAVVSQYFKLSDFNYFLGLVGSISVLILLGLTLLSFVERVISLVLLFVISPLPMSASPLDDGERFKIWREQTINKFLTAYGGLLALNIFALMLPMISSINFFSHGGTIASVANGIARLLFVIGGAFACRRGMVLIGNLVSRGAGSQELMDQSHLLSDMANVFRTAGRFITGGYGAVKGIATAGYKVGKAVTGGIGALGSAALSKQDQGASTGTSGSDAASREAEENRHDGRLDREREQNTNTIQSVMEGKPQAAGVETSTTDVKAPESPSNAKDSTNTEKSSELNSSAQNDIKKALENNKMKPSTNGDESDI